MAFFLSFYSFVCKWMRPAGWHFLRGPVVWDVTVLYRCYMGVNICIPSEVSVVDGVSFGGFDGTGFWYCVCISVRFCVWDTLRGYIG